MNTSVMRALHRILFFIFVLSTILPVPIESNEIEDYSAASEAEVGLDLTQQKISCPLKEKIHPPFLLPQECLSFYIEEKFVGVQSVQVPQYDFVFSPVQCGRAPPSFS